MIAIKFAPAGFALDLNQNRGRIMLVEWTNGASSGCRIAWAAAKRLYVKDDERWVLKG